MLKMISLFVFVEVGFLMLYLIERNEGGEDGFYIVQLQGYWQFVYDWFVYVYFLGYFQNFGGSKYVVLF